MSENENEKRTTKLNAEADINLGIPEKLAYGAGNFSYSIVWLPILSFLNFFWTDVAMIPAATAGIFLMISKLWDAINDPIIGNIEDHSNSRHGKYRPWLWTWIGIVIFFVLTFTKLDGASTMVQTIFSFIMYFLLVVFYTTYEMSHVSLMSVMTTNYECRSKLASYRMTFSNVSGVFLTSVFMGLVGYFGADNVGHGYIIACIIIAIVAIPFFLWCYFGTKERVVAPEAPKVPLLQALKAFIKCKPAVILALAHACWGICGGALSAARQYYFVYNVGDESLFTVAMTTWLAGMAVGSWAANWLIGLFKNKRTASIITWGITGIMLLVMQFADFASINMTLYLALWFVEGALGCVGFTAIFAMVPDVVEYEQARNGDRSSASFYACINFAMKAGQAIVIGVINLAMQGAGYVAGAVQNAAVLNVFNCSMHLVPAIFFLIGAVLFWFYRIDRSTHEAHLAELEK